MIKIRVAKWLSLCCYMGGDDKRLKTGAVQTHSPGTPRLEKETVPGLVHPDLLH